jgi:hypothetical protein
LALPTSVQSPILVLSTSVIQPSLWPKPAGELQSGRADQ